MARISVVKSEGIIAVSVGILIATDFECQSKVLVCVSWACCSIVIVVDNRVCVRGRSE